VFSRAEILAIFSLSAATGAIARYGYVMIEDAVGDHNWTGALSSL